MTVLVAIVAVALTAGFATTRMRADIFPDLDLPVIYVAQPYGGMSPAQMEGLIVNQFELIFQYIDGVQEIKSSSIQQVALVELAFYPGTNMATAMGQVVAMGNRAMSRMPPGTLPPLIMQMDAGSVPVGFVIAHPGANRQFDGNNAEGASASFRFDLPGRSQDLNYDDLMLAVGPGDLSARLGCAARLSEMQVAMQSSYAAYDTARVMQQYWSLLRFDIDQAESALESAEAGMALTAMGLALATTSAVLSIASAANTEGVTAFVVVIAAVNVTAAIVETVFAAQDLAEAQEDLQAARDKLVAGNAYAIHVYNSLADALDHAVVIDRKGLNP